MSDEIDVEFSDEPVSPAIIEACGIILDGLASSTELVFLSGAITSVRKLASASAAALLEQQGDDAPENDAVYLVEYAYDSVNRFDAERPNSVSHSEEAVYVTEDAVLNDRDLSPSGWMGHVAWVERASYEMKVSQQGGSEATLRRLIELVDEQHDAVLKSRVDADELDEPFRSIYERIRDGSDAGHSEPGAALDEAEVLALEAEGWLRNLAEKGIIPRALSWIDADGRKFITTLSVEGLDHHSRRRFLIWLLFRVEAVAYCYVTHVGKLTREDGVKEVQEGVDICASSMRRDYSSSLDLTRLQDRRVHYSRSFVASHDGSDQPSLFHGLHRSQATFDEDEEAVFLRLWHELRQSVHQLR